MTNPTKKISNISLAEWVVYRWFEVTTISEEEPVYVRSRRRPLDEALTMLGGRVELLERYLKECGINEIMP